MWVEHPCEGTSFCQFPWAENNKEQVDDSPKCKGMWINHGQNVNNPASCGDIATQKFGDTEDITNFEVCEGDVDNSCSLHHQWEHHKSGRGFLL